jgi:hypothetical protein
MGKIVLLLMDKNAGYGRETSRKLMALLADHHTQCGRLNQVHLSYDHLVGVFFDLLLPIGISSEKKHFLSQVGDMR